MNTTQLQAKGGEKWGFKLDPLTIMKLNDISEHLQGKAGVKPSQAVIVRRAIRLYSSFVQDIKTSRMLKDEKTELLEAAGRA